MRAVCFARVMTRSLFTGARIFDGTGAALAEADLTVEAGRIVEVGRGLDGDEVVDLTGKALLPGLFDCHVHVTVSHVDTWRLLQRPFSYQFFEAARNLEATLRAGVTSVRDAGGADLGVKQAVADGLVTGPRMQISIAILSQTGGHGDDWMPSGAHGSMFVTHPGAPSGVVDGPDAIRARVRELLRAGADVIKVCTSGGVLSPTDSWRHPQFAVEELTTMVATAAASGAWVMAHAQAAEGIKNAVRAGIRSIEHGVELDDEAVELMLSRGTWLVPTLVAPRGVLDAAAAGVDFPPVVVAKAREVLDIHRMSFQRAVAAGVRIAMGTDSGVVPHGRNLRELALMAEGGMKPEEVLAAATSSSAELLGVAADRGTLTPGRRADLLVIDGDPFDFERLPETVVAVYLDGVRVPAVGAPASG